MTGGEDIFLSVFLCPGKILKIFLQDRSPEGTWGPEEYADSHNTSHMEVHDN